MEVLQFDSLKRCLTLKEDQSPIIQATSNELMHPHPLHTPRGIYQEIRANLQVPRISDDKEEGWSLVVTRGDRVQRNIGFIPVIMSALNPTMVPWCALQPLERFQATERPPRIRSQPVWGAD